MKLLVWVVLPQIPAQMSCRCAARLGTPALPQNWLPRRAGPRAASNTRTPRCGACDRQLARSSWGVVREPACPDAGLMAARTSGSPTTAGTVTPLRVARRRARRCSRRRLALMRTASTFRMGGCLDGAGARVEGRVVADVARAGGTRPSNLARGVTCFEADGLLVHRRPRAGVERGEGAGRVEANAVDPGACPRDEAPARGRFALAPTVLRLYPGPRGKPSSGGLIWDVASHGRGLRPRGLLTPCSRV